MTLTRIKIQNPKDEFDLRLTREELFVLRGLAAYPFAASRAAIDALQHPCGKPSDGPTNLARYIPVLNKIWALTASELR